MTLIIAIALLVGITIGAFVKSAFKFAVVAAIIVGALYIAGERLPSLHEVMDGAQSEVQQLRAPTPIPPGIREARYRRM